MGAVRNHVLDCVVEAFSKANPEAARSKQDIIAMDRAERDASNQAVLKWLLRGEPAGAPKSAVDRENLASTPTPVRNRLASARASPRREELRQEGQQQRQQRPSSAGSAQSSACVVS